MTVADSINDSARVTHTSRYYIERAIADAHSYADHCRAQLVRLDRGEQLMITWADGSQSPLHREVSEMGIEAEAVLVPILERALTELD